MKKVCNRNMLFAAILCLQLNVVAAFGQTVVKGSVKDNTGKPVSGVVVTCRIGVQNIVSLCVGCFKMRTVSYYYTADRLTCVIFHTAFHNSLTKSGNLMSPA